MNVCRDSGANCFHPQTGEMREKAAEDFPFVFSSESSSWDAAAQDPVRLVQSRLPGAEGASCPLCLTACSHHPSRQGRLSDPWMKRLLSTHSLLLQLYPALSTHSWALRVQLYIWMAMRSADTTDCKFMRCYKTSRTEVMRDLQSLSMQKELNNGKL